MATPRLGLVVEDKPTELSCTCTCIYRIVCTQVLTLFSLSLSLSLSSFSHPSSHLTLYAQSPSSFADDLPRIAQLQNEIEKRDKTLLHCKKENEALKVI